VTTLQVATIDKALTDPGLLGAALGPVDTFATWLSVLKAAFGLKLSRSERRAFASVAGSRKSPRARVRELWAIVGRRGGKSRMAAALSVFVACFVDHTGKLAPGETGWVLTLAPTQKQARLVFSYALAFLQASSVLRGLIESTTAEEIRLAGNITIATHPNSFRSVRGRTLLGCIFDESAFWRDETSASPDVETYIACLPSLASSGGMLIGISSAYRRMGLLYQKFRDHYGQDDAEVLVVRGSTETFNPTIDRQIIEAARRSDPSAAQSEWDAEFRADISAFLDDATIDRSIDDARPLELPPRLGLDYVAFADASAGRHDAFTLCIGHQVGEGHEARFIADVVRGRKPPFDPKSVAAEFAKLSKDYRCRTIVGDNYAGEWVAQAFREAGAGYHRSDLPKSALYLEALPFFMRGAVSIPNQPQLIRELRLLERRTHRSGKDSVDHGVGGSDDYANAVAGAIRASGIGRGKAETRVYVGSGGDGFGRITEITANQERPRLRIRRVGEKQYLTMKEANQW
jgi:hypothetical protein